MTMEQFIDLLDELVLVACGSRQKKMGTVVYTLTLEDILEGSAIINRGGDQEQQNNRRVFKRESSLGRTGGLQADSSRKVPKIRISWSVRYKLGSR